MEFKGKLVCTGGKDTHSKQGCGAELEFTESDLKLRYWESTFNRHHYAAVECPACGIASNVKDLPILVWKKMTSTEAKRKKSVFDGYNED